MAVIQVGSTCSYGDLRLVGGSDQYEGRVEICINDAWGTVCDDFWGNVDAGVVCQQLGYGSSGRHAGHYKERKIIHSFTNVCCTYICTGSEAFSLAYFGPGSGPTHLDNVQCTGDEESLLECPSNAIGMENCGHAADAGVRCPGKRVSKV